MKKANKHQKTAKHPALKAPTPKELRALEGLVGQFMAYWGFKNIHGRIWLNLFVSRRPLDSTELMSRLKVSKAQMSNSLRELLAYDVIRAVATGRHGTVFYDANPNLQEVIRGVLKVRETSMLNEARLASQRLLKIGEAKLAACDLSLERIESVQSLTESAQLMLSAFVSWQTEPDRLEPDGFRDLKIPLQESEW